MMTIKEIRVINLFTKKKHSITYIIYVSTYVMGMQDMRLVPAI